MRKCLSHIDIRMDMEEREKSMYRHELTQKARVMAEEHRQLVVEARLKRKEEERLWREK